MSKPNLHHTKQLTQAASDDYGLVYNMKNNEWEITCDKPLMRFLREASVAVPALTAAIDAVLALHTPIPLEPTMLPICHTCLESYPCNTKQAITEHIDITEAP